MKFKKLLAIVITVLVFAAPNITKNVLSDSDFEKLDLIIEFYEPNNDISLFSVEDKTETADEIIKNLGLEVCETYNKIINGIATEGTVADIKLLESNPAVKKVYIATTYSVPEDMDANDSEEILSDTSTKLMDINTLDGTGTAIAVIDSEFRVTHESFLEDVSSPKISSGDIDSLKTAEEISSGTYYNSKIPFMYDYNGKDDIVSVSSGNGHGTHVAGIIAGRSSTMQGTAPNAQLILMKVFGDNGSGADDTIILKAMEDAVKIGVDVINISLGLPAGFINNLDGLNYENIIVAAKNLGITVCVSNGNAGYLGGVGRLNNPFPPTEITDYGSGATPATEPSAMAVAATSPGKTDIAYYSSRGAANNLSLKPDITGAGTIISASRTGDNTYTSMSGTSMASPYVSGAIATIKQYVSDTYAFMTEEERSHTSEVFAMNTANLLTDDGVYISPRSQGAGMINAPNASTSPIILYSEFNKGKVELFDNIGSSFAFDLYVKNFSSSEVSYSIECDVITDGYELGEGVNRITGKSVIIENTNVSFDCGNTVTLSSGETKKITVSISLDHNKVTELEDVFTNGFFIEGYVRLINPMYSQVSIPFMGYSSSWGEQTFIDHGLLHNNMVIKDGNGITLSKFSYEDGEDFVVLPSGGSIQLTSVPFLRNVVTGNVYFTDLSNNLLMIYKNKVMSTCKSYYDYSTNKYSTYNISPSALLGRNAEVLGDGEYYYKAVGAVEYKKEVIATKPYSLRIVTDSESPSADCVLKTDGDTALYYLRVKDNHAVKEVSIGSNTSEIGKASYNNDIETGITFLMTDNITVSDYAGNTGNLSNSFNEGFICTYNYEGRLCNVIIKDIPMNENNQPLVVIEPKEENSNVRLLIWDSLLNPVYAD